MTATLARYARDPLALIAELLHLPDGRVFGEVMAEFQRRDFEAVFAPGASPNAWISRPRGGSKTADMGAVVVSDLLVAPDRSQLLAVAADQDQARLLLDAVRTWTLGSPALEGSLSFSSNEATNPATGTRLRVLASDAPSAYGLTPYRGYLDEVTMWPNRDMFDAIATAAHKQPACRILITSTAGSPNHWSFDLWKHAHSSPMWQALETDELAPWVSQEQVEDLKAHLPSGVFERQLRNRWVAAEESFLTLEEVEGCIDSERQPSLHGDGNSAYALGVDLGLKHDAAAIVVVRVGHKKGRVHRLESLWTRQGSPEHPVVIAEVEEKIADLQHRFRPCRALVDPWQMAASAQRLGGIEEFTLTGSAVARLSSNLLTLIRERRLRLLPDAALRGELLSLTVRETSFGWRAEASPGAHDDRAFALMLAALAAEEQVNTRTPDTYVGTLGPDTGWTIFETR